MLEIKLADFCVIHTTDMTDTTGPKVVSITGLRFNCASTAAGTLIKSLFETVSHGKKMNRRSGDKHNDNVYEAVLENHLDQV